MWQGGPPPPVSAAGCNFRDGNKQASGLGGQGSRKQEDRSHHCMPRETALQPAAQGRQLQRASDPGTVSGGIWSHHL